MAELAAAAVKLAKKDREEANALLDRVIEQDLPRVKQLLGLGTNPDALIDQAHPCSRCTIGAEDVPNGTSALTITIVRNNLAIARQLLKAGASTELADVRSTMTCLMVAASNNNTISAELLMKWKANVEAVTANGSTALIIATGRGHAAMVRFLVDHGADPDVQSDAGDTALHYAAEKGHVEAARALLQAGASCDLDNGKGNTPAKYTILNEHFTVLELLLRYGASAHRAAVLPKKLANTWTEEAVNRPHISAEINQICSVLEEKPSLVHLLADHGGICDREELAFNLACGGSISLAASRRQRVVQRVW